MIPELQKGRVYYRCKRRACPTKTVREDVIDRAVRSSLLALELTAAGNARVEAERMSETSDTDLVETRKSIELQIADEEARLERLGDLMMDGTFDRDQYTKRKADCDRRLVGLQQNLANLPDPEELQQLRDSLAELQKSLCLTYDLTKDDENREFVEIVWPNRQVIEKLVY